MKTKIEQTETTGARMKAVEEPRLVEDKLPALEGMGEVVNVQERSQEDIPRKQSSKMVQPPTSLGRSEPATEVPAVG
jgi:hypothetical protein